MVYLIHISIYLSVYLSFCCIYSFSPNTRCFYKLYLLIVFYTVDQVCKCWLYIAQWFKFASVDCDLHSGSSLYLYFLTVFCTGFKFASVSFDCILQRSSIVCNCWLYFAQWFKFASVSWDCTLQRSSIVCNCWLYSAQWFKYWLYSAQWFKFASVDCM